MKSFFSGSLFGGPPPLHAAVSQGDLCKVQQVVQTGADVDAKDKEGSAPMHIAASRGFHTIVGELLDRQATATSTNVVRGAEQDLPEDSMLGLHPRHLHVD